MAFFAPIVLFLCVCGLVLGDFDNSWEHDMNMTAPWGRKSPLEGDLYQGDIMLDPFEDLTDRTSLRDRNSRWPGKTVYYVIDNVYNQYQRNVIKSAIAEYHSNTCLKFVEGRGNGNYIHVKNLNKGCWSWIGRRNGAQDLSLQIPGCMYKGVIMHEFMHAIGFWHEQSRTDRDNFVNINWNNIPNNQKYNFDKTNANSIDHLNTNYDYRSIMHYQAWSFAINRNQPTISPKINGWNLNDLGSSQNQGVFSSTDILKIKRFYEC